MEARFTFTTDKRKKKGNVELSLAINTIYIYLRYHIPFLNENINLTKAEHGIGIKHYYNYIIYLTYSRVILSFHKIKHFNSKQTKTKACRAAQLQYSQFPQGKPPIETVKTFTVTNHQLKLSRRSQLQPHQAGFTCRAFFLPLQTKRSKAKQLQWRNIWLDAIK